MIEEFFVEMASSPWVLVALFAFTTIDGFFPPVPSESGVIALAALWASTGEPSLALIAIAAALGAFTGDQIAYTIGSRIDVSALRFFRKQRGKEALRWAETTLQHRGAAFILAARYIPIGRVAVNLSAGALAYPRPRFVGITVLAATSWTGVGVLIGIGSGRWLEGRPLAAVLVGVAVGVVVGFAIDALLRRFSPPIEDDEAAS